MIGYMQQANKPNFKIAPNYASVYVVFLACLGKQSCQVAFQCMILSSNIITFIQQTQLIQTHPISVNCDFNLQYLFI